MRSRRVSKHVQNRRTVIVICGPIASGKSTVARSRGAVVRAPGDRAAVADLDLVYEMLEHDGAAKDRLEKWSRARRAAAALTDGLLDDGVGVVVVVAAQRQRSNGWWMTPDMEIAQSIWSARTFGFNVTHTCFQVTPPSRVRQSVEVDA